MVGIVLVTHCRLGEALLEAARFIGGNLRNVRAISVQDQNMEDLRKVIASAIEEVDEGDGVLVLTDMFGGTPSNISLSFLEAGKREVITGVNLPMLLSAINQQGNDLKALAAYVKQKAMSSIIHASEELNK